MMIKKIIICILGLGKLTIYKLFHWHNLKYKLKTIIYPSVHFQIARGSCVVLGRNLSIRRNVEINARKDAIIKIGNDCFFNSNCILTAHKGIYIGDNVEFGPNVSVFDHDHKYNDGYKKKEFQQDEIFIGNNVWIGAGCVILRGTYIADNCVIAAGSVLKGAYEKSALVYQRRDTIIKEK